MAACCPRALGALVPRELKKKGFENRSIPARQSEQPFRVSESTLLTLWSSPNSFRKDIILQQMPS